MIQFDERMKTPEPERVLTLCGESGIFSHDEGDHLSYVFSICGNKVVFLQAKTGSNAENRLLYRGENTSEPSVITWSPDDADGEQRAKELFTAMIGDRPRSIGNEPDQLNFAHARFSLTRGFELQLSEVEHLAKQLRHPMVLESRYATDAVEESERLEDFLKIHQDTIEEQGELMSEHERSHLLVTLHVSSWEIALRALLARREDANDPEKRVDSCLDKLLAPVVST